MALEVGEWLSTVAPNGKEPCGLFVSGGKSVPLKRRHVQATIFADVFFADTTETLSYVASEDCTATFKFPLPPRSAVYKFKAVMADREVVTEVKPKAQAEEEFRLATQQGHGAVLMKQEPTASIFTIDVGNLEAHTECVIEFSYLRLLDSFSGTIEYVHTATWVPPYIGSTGDIADGVENVVAGAPKFAQEVSYTITYDVNVRSEMGTIKTLECMTDEAEVTSSEDGLSAHVKLSESQSDASKDFTLLVELDSAKRTSAVLLQRTPATAATPSKTLALATFIPKLEAPSCIEKDAHKQQQQQAIARELWMVVDCSGSMGGTPIQQAREAALFFVKDLPTKAGVKFNVTVFGSSHKSLFGKCKEYDSTSEAQAVKWVQQHVQADLGGTEILSCLEHIYATPITRGYERSIIFLTDGGISGSEEQRVYDLVEGTRTGMGANVVRGLVKPAAGLVRRVKALFERGSGAAAQPAPAGSDGDGTEGAAAENGEEPSASAGTSVADRTTVLSLGIGHGVHRALLDGMAERSTGVAQYVVDNEGIAKKCSFLKKCALAQGMLLRPRISTPGAMVRAAPNVLPPRIFAGEPLHVLLEVVNSDGSANVELVADLPDGKPHNGKFTMRLPLSSQPGAAAAAAAAAVEESHALGVLHAMAYIGTLLAGTSALHAAPDGTLVQPQPSEEVVKDCVVRLAVAAHLVTPHTSAVGVLIRRDPLDPSGVKKIDVPLQVPHGRALWAKQQQVEEEMMRSGYGGGVPRCSAAPLMLQGLGGLGCGGRNLQSARKCRSVASGASPALRMSYVSASNAPAPGGIPPAAPVAYAAMDACMSSVDDEQERHEEEEEVLIADVGPQAEALAMEGACKGAVMMKEAKVKKERRASRDKDVQKECEEKSVQTRDAGAAKPALDPARALSYLNVHRTTEGYWQASQDLWATLALPALAVGGGVHAARPAGGALSDDAWATVVVLAFLRKHLAGQRDVWSDMEAKALTWLAGVWPAGGACKSVGAVVLATSKLL